LSSSIRPLLGPNVAARRHVADGERFVLLHDRVSGRIHRVTERAWAVLGAMDGTRDAEGLAAAARLRRFAVEAAEAHGFIEDVARAGLLADSKAALEASAGSATRRDDGDRGNESSVGVTLSSSLSLSFDVPPERPLEVLADYRLDCDGSGSCCRLFPTIVFTPRDVASARAVLPDVMSAGHDEQGAFTPSQGSRHQLSVVTLVDGRCGYLEPSGRCGIHAASAASWKPFGCRTFPLSFVDDGTSVRVVPRPECACVPRSARVEGTVGTAGPPGGGGGVSAMAGEALLGGGLRTRGDLALEAFVHAVPDPVPLAEGTFAPRDALARWSRHVAGLATPDAAAAFASLAASVEERGLDEARAAELMATPTPLDWEQIRHRLETIRASSAKRADDGFRSGRDLAQQAFIALETACALALAAPPLFTGGPRSEREAGAEAFHLRATIFGHLVWHLEGTTDLAEGLHALSARVIAARALGAVAEIGELSDPAFTWPLSLVEAMCRGYSLEAPEAHAD